MSDAATPSGAPAGGSPDEIADYVASLLGREDDAAEAADTDAEPVAQQPTEAAQPSEPRAGEDQAEANEPEQGAEEPPRYRVKVRGSEIEVPLPELLNGYSRTEDYKAKTAELAEQRRALDAAKAEITARQQALDNLFQQAPLDPVLAEGTKTDWTKLAQEDPAGYVAKRAAFEERAQYWQTVQQERMRAAAEAHQQRLLDADQKLRAAVPEWGDDAKRPELAKKLRGALASYGFEATELDGVADHRVLMVALDAMRWREAQAARQSAEQKRSPQPVRVMRPGASNDGSRGQSQAAQALAKRAKETGSTEDRVAAILAQME